ncbi:MAG: hypothetical protein JSS72_13735 [Armatimonadetes bacterium]|nr:hypothetical protein [Armatimonadota bacterium]
MKALLVSPLKGPGSGWRRLGGYGNIKKVALALQSNYAAAQTSRTYAVCLSVSLSGFLMLLIVSNAMKNHPLRQFAATAIRPPWDMRLEDYQTWWANCTWMVLALSAIGTFTAYSILKSRDFYLKLELTPRIDEQILQDISISPELEGVLARADKIKASEEV